MNRPLLWIGVAAAIFFAACRAVGLLMPFPWTVVLPVGFLVMMATPFVFADQDRRRQMGFARAKNGRDYVLGIVWGSLMALCCFGLGWLLFGAGADNWFVSIRDYYRANPAAAQAGVGTAFMIFTTPALIFSPLGEEIFFRGFLHEALQEKLSVRASACLDSAIFGAIHLFHHGITRNAAGNIEIHALSGIIWMGLMTATALVFTRLRARTSSLYPVILSHAAFNLVMNATIFVFFWPR
jgi:membrane protease YdiL (CAAX protease family)